MGRLIEHLPEQVHLVLMTRADPPLPLERLRGRRQLGETRAGDLRFNLAETRLLLQKMLGPEVSSETAALLEGSTEGWAVGLHLAGLSLQNWQMRGGDDPAALARKIAEHGHQAITEYLLSEVLAGLPSDQADCLLVTSLFERFCAALIDGAQAADDAERLPGDDFLRAVRRSNLFVVSLDDDGTWFRFHHFFQALLRARVAQRWADEEVRAVHARAGEWFCQQGLIDEAVPHFLAAGDPLAAAAVVEGQVHPALDREDWRQFERWIGLLPAPLHQRPRLLTAQAWLHVLRYQFAAAGPAARRGGSRHRVDPTGVGGAENLVRGEIGVLRSMIAYYAADFERTVSLTNEALGLLGPETMYATGQASLYHIWGLQGLGENARAIDFAHHQLEAYGLKANALTLRVLLVLVNTYYEMADLPRMQETTGVFEELARQSGLGASQAWVHFMHGWLHYQRNELAAARQCFEAVAAMSAVAHAKALVDGHVGLVLTALAQGCPDEAVTAIAEPCGAAWSSAICWHSLPWRHRWNSEWHWRSTRNRLARLAPRPGGAGRARRFLGTARADACADAACRRAPRRPGAGGRAAGRQQGEGCGPELHPPADRGRRSAGAGVCGAGARAGGASCAAGGSWAGGAGRRAAAAGRLRPGPGAAAGRAGGLRARTAEALWPALLAAVRRGREPPARGFPPETLTNREIDVLLLLAERLSDKEIAERLVLSPLTVKKHEQRIYQKLDVHGRRAAVAEARRLGLI